MQLPEPKGINNCAPDRIRQRRGWSDIPAVRSIVEIKSPLILQPGPAALTDGLDAIVTLWPNSTK